MLITFVLGVFFFQELLKTLDDPLPNRLCLKECIHLTAIMIHKTFQYILRTELIGRVLHTPLSSSMMFNNSK